MLRPFVTTFHSTRELAVHGYYNWRPSSSSSCTPEEARCCGGGPYFFCKLPECSTAPSRVFGAGPCRPSTRVVVFSSCPESLSPLWPLPVRRPNCPPEGLRQ